MRVGATDRRTGEGRTRRESGLRRRPAPAGAFFAQIRLMARRRLGLAGAALVVAGLLVVPLPIPGVGAPSASLSAAAAGAWAWLLAVPLVWPSGYAWRNEGPSARSYHWSLPVDRPVHQLLRLTAGWLLLLGAVAAGLALGGLAGGLAGEGPSLGDPTVLARLAGGMTLVYLLASVFALVFDAAQLAVVSAAFVILATWAVAHLAGWAPVTGAVDAVFVRGELSLAAALAPPTLAREVGPSVGWRPGIALGLWLGLAGLLAAAAASVRREPGGR